MRRIRRTSQEPESCDSFVVKLIVGLGEILWDVYPNGKFLGGAPANFAFHVHHSGHRGLVVSRVGRDKLGNEIVKRLGMFGLESRWIQRDATHPTGTVKVALDDRGIPSFQCTHDVAFDYLEPAPDWCSLAAEIHAVLFGTLAQRHQVSRAAIQEFVASAQSALKLYDVNIRGWNDTTESIVLKSLELASSIKLNDEELNTLQLTLNSSNMSPIEFLQFLLREFNIKLAALTLGERGCLLLTGQKVVYSPGFSVKVEDTTGAGDAFAAGLVVKQLEEADLRQTAEFANSLGALVATKKGATPGWNLTELHRLVAIDRSRIWAEEFREFG